MNQHPAVALPITPSTASPPTLWRVLTDTYRGASGRDRWALGFVLFAVLLNLGLQLTVDFDGGRGRWGVAETMSVLFGVVGGMLWAAVVTLQVSGQRRHSAGCVNELHPKALDAMLMASPVVASLATWLVGTAAGLSLARGLHLGPKYWFLTVTFLAIGLFIAHSVLNTTRFLYTHAREQAALAARSEAEAAEARLAALAAQLHPHYLFNALNTIAALVRTDPETAETTVENVAQVLRRTLDRSGRATAPLAEEIDYLKAYLAVEKARWGERLRVSYRITSEALDLMVPPLVLQPLVENALKHGLSERLEGGAVEIGAEAKDGKLVLTVTDDGLGLAAERREGTGLTNLSQRLATLYGAAATVTLEARPRGARATVTMPVSRA